MDNQEMSDHGCRSLLAAVVEAEVGNFRIGRKKDRKAAETYLFSDGPESTEYVFGFRFICQSLGIDYRKIRKQLSEEPRRTPRKEKKEKNEK